MNSLKWKERKGGKEGEWKGWRWMIIKEVEYLKWKERKGGKEAEREKEREKGEWEREWWGEYEREREMGEWVGERKRETVKEREKDEESMRIGKERKSPWKTDVPKLYAYNECEHSVMNECMRKPLD